MESDATCDTMGNGSSDVGAGFSNSLLSVEHLPALEDGDFSSLHPRYLRLFLIGLGIFLVASTAVLIIVSTQVDEPWIPLGFLIAVWVVAGIVALLKRLEVRHLGYQVREHDISFRHGVLSQHVETLPYIRVQHVRMNRGPIERKFGLAHLSVHSAGPDLNIPGLKGDEAERLRLFIVERAGALVETP